MFCTSNDEKREFPFRFKRVRGVIVRGSKISTRRYVPKPLWLLLGRVNSSLFAISLVTYKERVLDLPSCRTIVTHTHECRPIMLLFFYHNDYHLCRKINIVKAANHSVRKYHRLPGTLNVLNRHGLTSTASSEILKELVMQPAHLTCQPECAVVCRQTRDNPIETGFAA